MTPTPNDANFITVLGQPALRLRTPGGAQATVSLHGGQVLSWTTPAGDEQLYLSPQAVAGPGLAIRGGVPVIFPQFELMGPDRSLPRHGLARTRLWQLESQNEGGEHAQATLVLRDDEVTRALWPHCFMLEMTVAVSAERLDLELYAENTGDTSWPFSAALHTYLAVSELTQVRLQGLEGCHFLDRVNGDEITEDNPEKRFHGEIDRIYAQANHLLLRDGPRRMLIETADMPDVVLWNPGAEKCASLKDMPEDGWQRMLCVEAARINKPITLRPGESWSGRQSLVLQAS
jgi:glucose-6-phosphate 1-epimerase